jgi:hypothetical protein
VCYRFERKFGERSQEINAVAEAGVMLADSKTDEACTVCGEGSGALWGKFLGEYTLDLGPEIVVWVWAMERGAMLFVADSNYVGTKSRRRYSLDAAPQLPYCSTCTDEITSDRGLPPGTHITVFSS